MITSVDQSTGNQAKVSNYHQHLCVNDAEKAAKSGDEVVISTGIYCK